MAELGKVRPAGLGIVGHGSARHSTAWQAGLGLIGHGLEEQGEAGVARSFKV